MQNKKRIVPPEAAHTPLRILLADDHDVVRDGLRALLASHPGWEICGEAKTGLEAIALAGELRPDVVIMDLSMPDLNGLEATRRIRKAQPQIEILVLTMHQAESLAQEVFDAGARSMILKTNARRFLIAAVEALAEHKPFFTPRVSQLIVGGEIGFPPMWIKNASRKNLTSREVEIVQMIVEGKSTKKIASTLGRSIRTIEVHRAHIMDKLGLDSVVALVRYAIRNKFVEA